MNRASFEDKVVNLIFSKSLIKVIKETHFQPSDLDILKIIHDFSNTFEQKIQLYNQAKLVFTEKKSIKHAEKLIRFETRNYEEFIKYVDNIVFDTKIRTNPKNREESFLAKTYEGALSTILCYNKTYRSLGTKDNILSRYTISKRSVVDPVKPSDIEKSDELGECILGYKLKAKSFSMYNINNEYSDRPLSERELNKHIPLYSHYVNFPSFLSKFDLVAYKPEWEEYHINNSIESHTIRPVNYMIYGIYYYTHDFDEYSDAMIFMLNCSYVQNRTMDQKDEYGRYAFYMDHDNIDYGRIDKVELSEAPKEIMEDYLYAVQYVKKLEKVEPTIETME